MIAPSGGVDVLGAFASASIHRMLVVTGGLASPAWWPACHVCMPVRDGAVVRSFLSSCRPPCPTARRIFELGDKRVSITDTPGGRSIAWSFAPDNPIAVSTSPTTPDGVVEEFVRALEPVSGSELAAACDSVGVEC